MIVHFPFYTSFFISLTPGDQIQRWQNRKVWVKDIFSPDPQIARLTQIYTPKTHMPMGIKCSQTFVQKCLYYMTKMVCLDSTSKKIYHFNNFYSYLEGAYQSALILEFSSSIHSTIKFTLEIETTIEHIFLILLLATKMKFMPLTFFTNPHT